MRVKFCNNVSPSSLGGIFILRLSSWLSKQREAKRLFATLSFKCWWLSGNSTISFSIVYPLISSGPLSVFSNYTSSKQTKLLRHISELLLAFFQEFFQGVKSIVMQFSFVMLIFLLFSDQFSGGKSLWWGQTASGVAPPCPPVEESQAHQNTPLSKDDTKKLIPNKNCQDLFQLRKSWCSEKQYFQRQAKFLVSLVAEAIGLIHLHPTGENFLFLRASLTRGVMVWI